MGQNNYPISGLKKAAEDKNERTDQVYPKTVARLNYNDKDTGRSERGGKAKK